MSIKKIIKRLAESIFQSSWYPNKKILLESVPDMSCQTYPVFQFMLKRGLNKEYKLIWIVKNKKNFDSIRIKNVSFLPYKPKNWIEKIVKTYTLVTSRAILYANNYVGKVFDKQYMLYLKHGTCIKSRLKHAQADEKNESDECITISSFFDKVDSKELHMPDDRFVATGYPRNDYLFETDDFIKKVLPSAEGKKVILWMPTFRQAKNTDRVDSSFDMPLRIPCLYTEEECRKLNEELEQNNVLLVLKLHPQQDTTFIKEFGLSNFILLTDEDIRKAGIQLYQFVGSTDALITDYSSIYYDYLLTGKPVGITLDDFEVYEKETGFAFDNILDLLVGEYMKNAEDIISFVKAVSNGEDSKKELRDKVRDKVHDNQDCHSAERVYERVIFNINKRYAKEGDKK